MKTVENLWAAGTPLGESSQRSPRPHSWWGGVAAPSPRTPLPLSAFGVGHNKNPEHAVDH